ncbi:hypothetical protein [Ferrovibrio sp.]|uniref:hypothetical protein n=1 Tax=Ferrovibrio sp. TaxID=1917215 RepID=UPI00261D81B3|nr:hypothetical protein [Ferrovibrio sp.]
MSEIAARCGVTRAAVSRVLKARGIKHDLKPGTSVRAVRAESDRLFAKLMATENEEERQRLILNFRAATFINLMDEASRIAAAGGLAPKSLRDLTAAVADLEDRMVAIGLIPGQANEPEKLSTMHIRVMTDEEAAEMRQSVEADHSAAFDDGDATEEEKTDTSTPTSDKLGAAVSEAATQREAAKSAIVAEAVARQLGVARGNLDKIHTAQGMAGLRALALRIGIKAGLPRKDAEKVKAMILDKCREQPDLISSKIAA